MAPARVISRLFLRQLSCLSHRVINPLALDLIMPPSTPSSISRADYPLLLDIADRFGTPTYAYFESVIEDRVRKLKSHLEGLPLQLLYAMKANHAIPVMEKIRDEGLGIDAVSPAELILALRLGFEKDRILFSANNMTDDEMHLAVKNGVILNVGELSRLEAFGKAYPGASVCVRLNPQIGAGHHEHVITAGEKSKFGIPVEQIDEIHRITAEYDIHVAGLHQHIGSGILDTSTLWRAISVILDASQSFRQLRFINVGGGLGVPYQPEESGLDMEHFESMIVQPLKAFIDSHASRNLSIWFEPGRYFTAESGVLLASVNTVKQSTTRTFAGTDSGMNHLVRPSMYSAYHRVLNLSNPDGSPKKYDVVGNICESSDFFAKERMVAELAEGDVVGVMDTGAYGISMATMYNLRSLPAEVWVDSNGDPHLIRDRKTPEQMVNEVFEAR